MKHKGKAASANLRIIFMALVGTLALLAVGLAIFSKPVFLIYGLILGALLIGVIIFCFNFFHDPDAKTPESSRVIVSPAHGKVDFIGEANEAEFINGPCKRISIFLSVFDVHIQNAPISGKVAYFKHSPGKFLNALKVECADHNENVLLGLESSERKGEKIGVRLIAGLIARRIVPWVGMNDELERGQRISLIQFGSRVDLFLPLSTNIVVKLGDHVVGGETVMAERKDEHA